MPPPSEDPTPTVFSHRLFLIGRAVRRIGEHHVRLLAVHEQGYILFLRCIATEKPMFAEDVEIPRLRDRVFDLFGLCVRIEFVVVS
jgi:hypothetical protein